MATSLTTFLRLVGNIRQTNAGDQSTPTDEVTLGVGTSGSAGFSAVTVDWANGTSNGQANEWFHDTRTVAATTADNLDLAGSLTNKHGETITFTVIKLIFIRILAADGTKTLQVGPRNQSNPWQGPWGGTAAGNYLTVHNFFLWSDDYGIGSITGGSSDVLGIYNSSASELSYDVILIGED